MSDDLEYGPAMLALKESQRAFVNALLQQSEQNYTRAYMSAYPDASYDTANVNGIRLAHNSKILDALHEEAGNRLRSAALLGASVIRQIANDPTHKDQLKAATTLLNRIGLHERTEHKVTVERPTDDVEIIQRIVDLGKSMDWTDAEIRAAIGHNTELPIGLLAAPIDAEFEEVGSTVGLDDIL